MRLDFLLLSIALATAPAVGQACWHEAARTWGVPASLLYAIAKVESSLTPQAVNRSHMQRSGSYDIGLMQINSSHLPVLARYGIRESDLFDACTNLQVAAWLLAHNFARWGHSWEAIGAYNASCTQLKGAACRKARSSYAWRVYQHLPKSTRALFAGQSPAKSQSPWSHGGAMAPIAQVSP